MNLKEVRKCDKMNLKDAFYMLYERNKGYGEIN